MRILRRVTNNKDLAAWEQGQETRQSHARLIDYTKRFIGHKDTKTSQRIYHEDTYQGGITRFTAVGHMIHHLKKRQLEMNCNRKPLDVGYCVALHGYRKGADCEAGDSASHVNIRQGFLRKKGFFQEHF
jgi:hypothetical protein